MDDDEDEGAGPTAPAQGGEIPEDEAGSYGVHIVEETFYSPLRSQVSRGNGSTQPVVLGSGGRASIGSAVRMNDMLDDDVIIISGSEEGGEEIVLM